MGDTVSQSVGAHIFTALAETAARIAVETGCALAEASTLAIQANWFYGGLDVVGLLAIAVERPTLVTRCPKDEETAGVAGTDRDWYGEAWPGLERGSPAVHALYNLWWELTTHLEEAAGVTGRAPGGRLWRGMVLEVAPTPGSIRESA